MQIRGKIHEAQASTSANWQITDRQSLQECLRLQRLPQGLHLPRSIASN
jgi:outer membrane scaffolding protein for murein synthesis (MipA/OmpV family)